MRRFALCLALLVLAGCRREETDCCMDEPIDSIPNLDTTFVDSGASAAAPSQDTAWVVRFDGAGPLRVGMTFGEARAALGGDLRMSDLVIGTEPGPDRCDHPRSGRLPPGVLVMVEGRRVVRVQVDSGSVFTAEGARIGDTESCIPAA